MSATEILTEVDAALGRSDTYPLDAIPGFVRDLRVLIDAYRELESCPYRTQLSPDQQSSARQVLRCTPTRRRAGSAAAMSAPWFRLDPPPRPFDEWAWHFDAAYHAQVTLLIECMVVPLIYWRLGFVFDPEAQRP